MGDKFDSRKSVLPKWLIGRGIGYGFFEEYKTENKIKKRIMDDEEYNETNEILLKKLKKKLDESTYKTLSKGIRREIIINKGEIKMLKRMLKKFNIVYFKAADVERAFREALGKKH